MNKQIGIDLGTANTIFYMKGKGIILREPSVVAKNKLTGKVVSVGSDAKKMLGKTPGTIAAFRPLKGGVIADFEVTAEMLHQFFRKINTGGFFNRPNVIICIPYGVTEVEKKAFEDAAFDAMSRSVDLVEEPMAAAIGAGLRIGSPRGSMIVDIGGGTTEVAVISLDGIVVSRSLRVAGDELDDAIVQYIRRKFNVTVGTLTGEELKKRIGSVHWSADSAEMEVRGRNMKTGLPTTLHITSADIREATEEQIDRIIDCIKTTLEITPPELSADIYDTGVTLAGGGALLRGLPELITERTGLRTTVANRPLDCVALGLGKGIEDPRIIRNVVLSRSR
ncbi:MAG: rod shape-determining protein [Clostridia bacterium]|nr:rod shape-determining protein [Clostridia bacterium]